MNIGSKCLASNATRVTLEVNPGVTNVCWSYQRMLALEETPAEDPKHYAQGAVICSDTAFVPVGLRMNGLPVVLVT